MVRFVLRRLALTIPVLVGVSTLVFLLIHLIPGDPVQAMLGDSASPQDIETLRERLGLNRAEAVKRYLYEKHQLPLHKMNVISYGEEKPAAENKTRDGRAQNRRVVIKVLA